MELCWDNMENVILTKNGNFRDIVKKRTLYIKICKRCDEEYIGKQKSIYCSIKCLNSGKLKGKILSEERKREISETLLLYYKNTELERKQKVLDGFYSGKNCHNWKGGYKQKGVAIYDTCVHQLEWCEEVRRNKEDPNVLEVRCFKCGKWYIPTYNNVNSRMQHLKGNYAGSNHFYCSKECKNSCSIFRKTPEQVEKQDAVRVGRLPWIELSREVQPELRSMVLERDEHKCVKCNDSNNLQCHHILPVNIEPLLSADIDNCITLCKECHVKVHQKDGCGYNQLKQEIC